MCDSCQHGKMMEKKGYKFVNGQFVSKKTGKPAPASMQPHAHAHEHNHSHNHNPFFNY